MYFIQESSAYYNLGDKIVYQVSEATCLWYDI